MFVKASQDVFDCNQLLKAIIGGLKGTKFLFPRFFCIFHLLLFTQKFNQKAVYLREEYCENTNNLRELLPTFGKSFR